MGCPRPSCPKMPAKGSPPGPPLPISSGTHTASPSSSSIQAPPGTGLSFFDSGSRPSRPEPQTSSSSDGWYDGSDSDSSSPLMKFLSSVSGSSLLLRVWGVLPPLPSNRRTRLFLGVSSGSSQKESPTRRPAWLSFLLVVPFFPLVVLVLRPVLVFPSRALRRDCWSCSIAAASPNCSAALAASVSFSFVALPGVRLKTSPTLDLRFCRRRFSARRRLFLIVRDCRRFNRVPALAGTCVLCMLVCFLVSSVALKLTLF